MPLTENERQQRLRDKHRTAGSVRYDVPVPAALDRKLRALAEKSGATISKTVIALLERAVSRAAR